MSAENIRRRPNVERVQSVANGGPGFDLENPIGATFIPEPDGGFQLSIPKIPKRTIRAAAGLLGAFSAIGFASTDKAHASPMRIPDNDQDNAVVWEQPDSYAALPAGLYLPDDPTRDNTGSGDGGPDPDQAPTPVIEPMPAPEPVTFIPQGNFRIRTAPSLTGNEPQQFDAVFGAGAEIQVMAIVKGDPYNDSEDWYLFSVGDETRYVHTNIMELDNGTLDRVLEYAAGQLLKPPVPGAPAANVDQVVFSELSRSTGGAYFSGADYAENLKYSQRVIDRANQMVDRQAETLRETYSLPENVSVRMERNQNGHYGLVMLSENQEGTTLYFPMDANGNVRSNALQAEEGDILMPFTVPQGMTTETGVADNGSMAYQFSINGQVVGHADFTGRYGQGQRIRVLAVEGGILTQRDVDSIFLEGNPLSSIPALEDELAETEAAKIEILDQESLTYLHVAAERGEISGSHLRNNGLSRVGTLSAYVVGKLPNESARVSNYILFTGDRHFVLLTLKDKLDIYYEQTKTALENGQDPRLIEGSVLSYSTNALADIQIAQKVCSFVGHSEDCVEYFRTRGSNRDIVGNSVEGLPPLDIEAYLQPPYTTSFMTFDVDGYSSD